MDECKNNYQNQDKAKDVTFLQFQKQKINPKNHRKFFGSRFDIKGREIERFKRTKKG